LPQSRGHQRQASRAGLAERLLSLTICEPIDRLSERLIELIVLALDERSARMPNQVILPMVLYTPENL
jgi:hypothetical protein